MLGVLLALVDLVLDGGNLSVKLVSATVHLLIRVVGMAMVMV